MKRLVFLGMASVLLGIGVPIRAEEEKTPSPPPGEIQLTPRIDFRMEGGAVSAIAFIPDGRKLLTGGEKGDLILWDTLKGGRLALLDAHEGRVYHLALDPSGDRLASVGRDLALWKVEDLSLIKRIPARRGTNVAWSPDGKWIAYDEEDEFLVIRDARTLRIHRRIWRKGGLDPFAFSTDGRRIALESLRGSVMVLEVETGREVASKRSRPDSGVSALGFLPGGDLVTALKDGRITWGDVEVRHSRRVRCMAISPDGSHIAASGTGGEVHVWDDSGVLVQVIRGSGEEIGCLAYSPDGSTLSSGGEDGFVHLRRNGSSLKLTGHASRVESLAFSRDGTHLAASNLERTLFVDLESRKMKPGNEGGALAPGHAGAGILLVGAKAISLWDASGGHRIRSTPRRDDGGKVEPVSLSPDGGILAAFRSLVGVLLLPTDVGEVVRFGGGSHQVFDLAWSPDGEILATANSWGIHGDSGGMTLVDRYGRTLRQELVEGPVSTVAFRPDGRALAWADGKGVHLRDSRTLEEMGSKIVKAEWFRFMSDRLAVSHDSAALTFWKLPSFEEVGRSIFKGIRTEAISPDRRHLALSDGLDVRVFRIDRGGDLPPPP